MSTITPPSTTTPTLDTLRERFGAGLLTATASAEAEELRGALAMMREAFDQMAALATAGPRVAETAPAARLGPRLPNWGILHGANPLVEETLADTINLVVLHLEGIAFAIERIRGDGLPRRLGPSLAQSVHVAIAALRVHLPRPEGRARP